MREQENIYPSVSMIEKNSSYHLELSIAVLNGEMFLFTFLRIAKLIFDDVEIGQRWWWRSGSMQSNSKGSSSLNETEEVEINVRAMPVLFHERFSFISHVIVRLNRAESQSMFTVIVLSPCGIYFPRVYSRR